MPADTTSPHPDRATLRVGTPEALAALPDPAGMPHVLALDLGARTTRAHHAKEQAS